MAFADINTLIRVRDAGPAMAVKAVFVLYNRPPYAVIGRKSRGITTPKDLEGKTLGAPATDPSFAQWPIFVRENKIEAAKVTVENVSLPVREPMLAAGQIDAITGSTLSSYIDLKDKGVPVDDIAVLLMADYGVTLYGNAILVNTKFATEHPEAVSGFLRAFTKGLKEAVRQPSIAIEPVLKRNSAAKKNIELERLTLAIKENIVTPEVKMNGYGSIDEERFARAIDQIGLAHKFKSGKPKPGDIFDGSFLPPTTGRKVN
jgi:NitT/TauT family transport system substrate-binding protein